MIRASLTAGRSVFYKSSGQSMWPLVQSGDACTFHPIQAVTAKKGKYSIQKVASKIDVGDIVFCQVQPSQQLYAHIVHEVQRHSIQRPKYLIGNVQRHINGWCRRERIFGILHMSRCFRGGGIVRGRFRKSSSRRCRRWYRTIAGTTRHATSVCRCGGFRTAGLRAADSKAETAT